MNFKEIIKQEWEEEFPDSKFDFKNSIFQMYNSMVERICIKVWNQAIQTASEHGECDCDTFGNEDLIEDISCALNRSSIFKLLINDKELNT